MHSHLHPHMQTHLHTRHIHTCTGKTFPQSHSTAQGRCPCYYFVHTHPPHPNSSEDGVCWLKGGLGLGLGISWKPNKKFKAGEEIIQRHASNMGHAEDTRVTPANLATGPHLCSSHYAPARFPFLFVRLCKWDRLS